MDSDTCSAIQPRPEQEVLPYVAPRLRRPLEQVLTLGWPWLEIRIASGRPLCVRSTRGDLWPNGQGRLGLPEQGIHATTEDIERTVHLVTGGSVYAWEEELSRGFCTLPGGHRVGLVGRVRWQPGGVVGQKGFSSVNLRVARAVPGCANAVIAAVVHNGRVASTLVYGAPGSGKTTLLRDMARLLSVGVGGHAWRVVVADERSEIAGCLSGQPQFDLGPRMDVLDGAPKTIALPMLIRSMGPDVVVCDEIGGAEDAAVLAEVTRSGVAVLASAHAGDRADLQARPSLRRAIRSGAFTLGVGLGRDRSIRECGPLNM